MKNIVLCLIVVAFVSFLTLTGCEKTSTGIEKSELTISELENPTKEIKNETSFLDSIDIGKIHNDGLDYVFDQLLLLKNERNNAKTKTSEPWWISEPEFFESVAQYGEEYLEIYLPSGTDMTLVNDTFRRGLKLEWIDPVYVSTLVESSDLLDEAHKLYVNEFILIFSQESSNMGQIISKLKQLRNDIRKNVIDSQEKVFLLSMISAQLSSIEYWKKNLDKWMDLLDISEEPAFLSILGADGWGFVGGALIGSPGGLIGAGIVGVGGLLGGSIGMAIWG